MTEVQPYTTAEARPDLLDTTTDSWVASVADVVKLAGYICDTEFVPNGFRGSAPATAAAILYGREIGVAPMTALATLHVVHGRVGMSAELMRARVLAAGHEIEVTESTAAVCRMRGRRRGSQTWTEVSWSKGDAQLAGLRGDNWTKYPRAMLVARASAELCRLVFPDVTHGMAATEELDGGNAAADTAAPTPPRRVARATKAAAPSTPSPGGTPAGDPLPPVAAPTTPPPPDRPPLTGDPQGPDSVPPVEVVTEPTAPAAGVVSETPPPGEGGSTDAPPTPPPVVVPDPPPPPLPGEDDPAALPLDIPPEDLEADPRAQSELRGKGPATPAQMRHVWVLLRKIGVGATREERLRIAQAIVQRPVESFNDLTMTDAGHLITTLLLAADSAQPRDYLRWLVDEGHRVMADRDAEMMHAADTEGET